MLKINEIELKVEIIRNKTNYNELADKIGMSRSSFYKELSVGNLKMSTINKLIEILNLSRERILEIFFAN